MGARGRRGSGRRVRPDLIPSAGTVVVDGIAVAVLALVRLVQLALPAY